MRRPWWIALAVLAGAFVYLGTAGRGGARPGRPAPRPRNPERIAGAAGRAPAALRRPGDGREIAWYD